MHISLDSALGQQRRLNSVGESITQIAPDPAAAYSLRSLTGGDPKVVRVRRGSDNHEQDFTASDVSSGALQDFVNAQVVAPLDIQALSATGRDGDFLIAKAAYSLRSLGTRQATVTSSGDTAGDTSGKYVVQVRRNVNGDQKSFTATEVTDGTLTSFVNESFTSSLPLDVQGSATAAYSLRNLSSSYTGNVVEVRRSSDDTTQNFKAAEVTDGTLLAFVNEDVTIYQSDFSVGVNGFDSTTTTTATGNQDGVSDSAGTSKNNVLKVVKETDNQAYIERDQGVVAGLTYTVSGSVFTPASNTTVDGIAVKDGISGSSPSNFPSGYLISAGTWADFSFSYTATVNGNQRVQLASSSLGGNINGISTGSTGDIVYIADLKFVQTASNGFVKTWYDQSGNSNDAVQATAGSQPKIVSAGALLADGIDFDGTDDELETGANISGSAISGFVVANLDGTAANSLYSIGNTKPNVLFGNPSLAYSLNGGAALSGGTAPTNTDTLFTQLFISGGTSKTFIDGGAIASGDAGSNTASSDKLTIGNLESGNRFMDGSIEEMIIYDSDQSENRRAIEESISGNYGITLGSFNRNGFVRTWYDQSVTTQAGDTATGNHAVQTAVSSMPTIVSNGTLLADGIEFDGSNDRLVSSNGITVTTSSDISFSLVGESDDITSTQTIVSQKSGTGQGRSWTDIVSSNFRTSIGSSAKTFGSVSANGTPFIYTFILDESANTGNAFKDGSQSGSQQSISAAEAANGELVIGSNNGESGQFFNGHLEEVIVYLSDQTDNRTAIEANIGEAYSIDLPSGVDPGFDQVDGFVETWYDQSGNSNDVTQSTASKQPKIVNAGSLVTVNSKASFKFDGTDDFLERETYTQGTLSQPNTFFSVAKLDAYADENRKVYDSHLSTARNMLQLSTTGNGQFAHFAGTVAATGEDADADRHLFTSLLNGAASNLRIDSTSKTTATTNTQGMTGIVIGANHDTANNFWDGDMQEIIVYNSNETSNFTALETNINSHYSIF